jgi:hypothetical protein
LRNSADATLRSRMDFAPGHGNVEALTLDVHKTVVNSQTA